MVDLLLKGLLQVLLVLQMRDFSQLTPLHNSIVLQDAIQQSFSIAAWLQRDFSHLVFASGNIASHFAPHLCSEVLVG